MTQGNNDTVRNTQSQQNPLGSFVNNLNKDDVAAVSGGGVSITLRSAKERAEGEIAQKALSFNPLKYWQYRDRNARQ